MMKTAFTPWHHVVHLRDDLKTGELSLSIFAADLYDVVMEKGSKVYRDPYEFFSLTYPTINLRNLAKDVVLRLAGQSDKAIRQLELTYGGGKTHTLITLYHLTHHPESLPDLPAVHEFTQHIGQLAPQTRIAILPFDKLDVERGMEIKGPHGEVRWLKHPWSILAFQLAGDDGLRLLHAEGLAEERESAPAENLLVDLLSYPAQDGLATLLLIDEVLMYVRGKVGLDPVWRSRLIDFFQGLTQAATKVRSCAIVASLLATDPLKSDMLGKDLTQELYAIFRREREEGVQPVEKADVAEVLRRRFFQPDSIKSPDAFRPHVVAALQGIAALDEQTRKDMHSNEVRFLQSFPFHPDLTEIFYTKWTHMESFQRTRGILRTFAMALREAERWDTCPLVSTNVFLNAPGEQGLSQAARELTGIASTEEYEGKKQEWSSIIEGELAKARQIQDDEVNLHNREVEQLVFATFLHSQPIGQEASIRDLYLLVGHTRPDKIELDKALREWIEVSWFLDESHIQKAEAGPDGVKQLPKKWRLGSRPNLRQMHHDACLRISQDVIATELTKEIANCKSLVDGASAAGAKIHRLPERPRDIDDNTDFHYVILGPQAASMPNRPSAEARRFIDEKAGPGSPRVYRNSILLVVPSEDGLESVRNEIRRYLGWVEVEGMLKGQEEDSVRQIMLKNEKNKSLKTVGDLVRQAYCIVVTVNEKNEIIAFKLTPEDGPLFNAIKKDSQSRIKETAVAADALLPGGPYNLWREGDVSHRLVDLTDAFAHYPRLPKVLKMEPIQQTLLQGCRDGILMLRVSKTGTTYWRQEPESQIIRDLEVVLPESASLSSLRYQLLLPGELPGLRETSELNVATLYEYFSGEHVIFDEYNEPHPIPKADAAVINLAVQEAVKASKLWLLSGQASIYGEDVPEDILNGDAILQGPPPVLHIDELLREALPEGWNGDETNALLLATALSTKYGKALPWKSVRDVLTQAFNTRKLERTVASAPWPSDYAGARAVTINLPKKVAPPPAPTPPSSPEDGENLPPSPPPASQRIAEATLTIAELQDLSDNITEIKGLAVGHTFEIKVRLELDAEGLSEENLKKINDLLKNISDRLRL